MSLSYEHPVRSRARSLSFVVVWLSVCHACLASAASKPDEQSPKEQSTVTGAHSKVGTRRTGGPTGKRGGARAKQLRQIRATRYTDHDKAWHEQPNLTGHWFGARPWVEERGLVLEPGYSVELASVLSGSGAGKTSLGGLFDLVGALKGDPLGLGNSKLVLIGQVAHGDGVSEGGVEDLQIISNIDCPDRHQFSELWLRQELAGGRLWFKLGKMDANVDFAALELAAELIHSSFGVPPNIPLPTFPDPGYGAAVAFEPSQVWRYELGFFEGAPSGLRWLPGKETFANGFVALAEATAHTAPLFGRGKGGSVHLGAWHRRPTGASAEASASGAWALFEEPFWSSGSRLAAVFGQLSWDFGANAVVPLYVGGGLLTQGVFDARDHDVISLAIAQARLTGGAETAVELQYKLPIIASVNLAIDLQYIDQPAGHAGSALAGLMRLTTLL